MKDDPFAALIALDRRGVFPREGESADAFLSRVNAVPAENALPEEFQDALPIPENIIAECGDLTEKLFAFRRRGDRGFFLSRGVGFLWGGCAVTDGETGQSFFLLRDAFARKKKWLCYRRDELLAHELCHLARASLDDPVLEEYFAYRTSFSALRRALGDVFTTPGDAVLFLLPTLLLPVASLVKLLWLPALPMGCFYALLGAVLGGFAIRSIARRHIVHQAGRKLKAFGVRDEMALLFRSTAKECAEIAKLTDEASWRSWLNARRSRSLRWEIIARRFCA